jgi:hypothetical protein
MFGMTWLLGGYQVRSLKLYHDLITYIWESWLMEIYGATQGVWAGFEHDRR